jgi:hypothetical protein
MTKKGYPRYKPEKVTCSICKISWSGNKNGLARHEVICRKMRGS